MTPTTCLAVAGITSGIILGGGIISGNLYIVALGGVAVLGTIGVTVVIDLAEGRA